MEMRISNRLIESDLSNALGRYLYHLDTYSPPMTEEEEELEYQRSIRGFHDEPLTEEEIKHLKECNEHLMSEFGQRHNESLMRRKGRLKK